jgi:hypothetical protein
MYDLPKLAAIIANERLVNHMPHQSNSWPFHTYNTVHHIGVKYIGHVYTEHLATPLKSLCAISTKWEGELYCGLTLVWNYAPMHYSIGYNTVFASDQGPARQLHPNSCHRAFVLHLSA